MLVCSVRALQLAAAVQPLLYVRRTQSAHSFQVVGWSHCPPLQVPASGGSGDEGATQWEEDPTAMPPLEGPGPAAGAGAGTGAGAAGGELLLPAFAAGTFHVEEGVVPPPCRAGETFALMAQYTGA